MTEDELLEGLLDAAFYGGWLVHHVRRSDLAQQQGQPGFPDLMLCHEQRRLVLAIECKAERGRYREGQQAWLAAFMAAGIQARTCTPADYDATVRLLLGNRLAGVRRSWTDDPDER